MICQHVADVVCNGVTRGTAVQQKVAAVDAHRTLHNLGATAHVNTFVDHSKVSIASFGQHLHAVKPVNGEADVGIAANVDTLELHHDWRGGGRRCQRCCGARR